MLGFASGVGSGNERPNSGCHHGVTALTEHTHSGSFHMAPDGSAASNKIISVYTNKAL